MQSYSWRTRPVLPARSVPGRHAKSSPSADAPGKTAGRILITAVMVGSLAAGSAATYELSATGSMSARHHSALTIFNTFMY
jgi:hypothetical protein